MKLTAILFMIFIIKISTALMKENVLHEHLTNVFHDKIEKVNLTLFQRIKLDHINENRTRTPLLYKFKVVDVNDSNNIKEVYYILDKWFKTKSLLYT